MSLAPQQSSSPPCSIIDHSAFPHIYESILQSVNDWDTLLTLRLVSRSTQLTVDADLFSHFVIEPSKGSGYALRGTDQLPSPPLSLDATWTNRLAHLTVLDVLSTPEEARWEIPFLSELSEGKLLAPQLKMIRRATPTTPDLCLAPTVVDVVDVTRRAWGTDLPMFWVQTKVQDATKHVIIVRCDGGVWPLVFMSPVWRTTYVVFLFRGVRDKNVRPPSSFRESWASSFISLAVNHHCTRFTFVGLCDLDDEMLGVSSSVVHDTARELAPILPGNEEYPRSIPHLPVQERLEFISTKEYVNRVGEEAWELEKWDDAPFRCWNCTPTCSQTH